MTYTIDSNKIDKKLYNILHDYLDEKFKESLEIYLNEIYGQYCRNSIAPSMKTIEKMNNDKDWKFYHFSDEDKELLITVIKDWKNNLVSDQKAYEVIAFNSIINDSIHVCTTNEI